MKRITLNGVTRSLTAWAAQVGIDRSTIGQRLNKGWSVAAALNPKDTRGSHQKGRRWPEWVKKKIGAGVKRAGGRDRTRIRFVPFDLIPDLLPNDQGFANSVLYADPLELLCAAETVDQRAKGLF